jgi:hypothetical protein
VRIAIVPAIWISGALLVLLFPSGLLLAAGGILLARDYGGSVEWMMEVFWRRQFGRFPPIEGRLGRIQMRGVGVGVAVIGLGWAFGGAYSFVDGVL